MEQLSREAFDSAADFVMTAGRPLDQAMWRHLFDAVPADDVIDALGAFRTPDGGFGRALEPDLRAPGSSALATQTALDTLHRLGDPGHQMVVEAVAYLVDTFDHDAAVWRFTPRSAGEHPHAPWWDQDALADAFEGFAVNPRAKLLGYLLWSGAPDGASVVDAIYDDVLDLLMRASGPVDVNTLDCFRTFAGYVRPSDREAARAQLGRLVEVSVERDDTKWDTHCLRPLDAVSGPDDSAVAVIADLVDRHLDFEIHRQRSDGSWGPTWSWYGSFPETWPQAEREWSSFLTVETVRRLAEFGRLAD